MADDDTSVTQTRQATGDPLALARLFCERVPHSRDLDMVIVPTDGLQVRMRLSPKPHLLDAASTLTICSSVLLSLCDSAAGLAVFAATQTLAPIATLDLRMNYLRPAPGNLPVTVSATSDGVTDNVAFVRCVVHAEGSAEPVATGDATFMRGTRGRRFDSEALPEARPATRPEFASQVSRDSASALYYADHLGVEVLPGKDQLRPPYRDALIGNVLIPALHGGVVAGLIEEAARVAVRTKLGGMPALRVLNSNIDYHRPARPMHTYASFEIARHTRRTVLVHVVCWQAEDRCPVATGRVQILLEAAGANPAVAGASA